MLWKGVLRTVDDPQVPAPKHLDGRLDQPLASPHDEAQRFDHVDPLKGRLGRYDGNWKAFLGSKRLDDLYQTETLGALPPQGPMPALAQIPVTAGPAQPSISLSERAGLKPCTLVQVFQIFRVWMGLLQSACERQPDWKPYDQQAHGASGVGDEVSISRAGR